MLTSLRIKDLGVIDEVTLKPAPGLTALTGETGAGKTMIVTGLGILLGSRTDARLVRAGARRSLVEGTFEVSNPDDLIQIGAEPEAGEVLFSRQISAAGRSQSFVQGVQVPLSKLASLVGEYATLHGQLEQIRLGTSQRQREVLDLAAGNEQLLADYRSCYAQRSRCVAELATITENAQARAREHDLLAFGLDEITKVDPKPGEDTELAVEAQKLQAIDDLRQLAARASRALTGSPTGEIDEPGAVGLLGEVKKQLSQVNDLDPSAATLAANAEQASFLVNDLAADVASYLADLDANPLRLEAIGERLANINDLRRKYGHTIEEILDWAAKASTRVLELTGDDERVENLTRKLAKLDAKLAIYGQELSESRRKAADRLASAVVAELAALAMPKARLRFELEPLKLPGPDGCEQVHLMFSANPGAGEGPLAKVASGGELSRIRLALEVVLAVNDPGHVFVFDEVDAGVGGAVATEIGRRLACLAKHSQVIVVTHLAQVAAFAHAHYRVAKSSAKDVTTSNLTLLNGQERLTELARMMSGTATQTALAHAKELLENATV